MRKTFLYRLYPTKTQGAALTGQLREACTMYNAALQERRDAWKLAGKSIGYYDQANQLKEIRAKGFTGLANFSCCQDVLRRLDKAFQAFFRRIKAGETPGYPRFKPHQRFDSITFPTHGDGCKLLDTGKLRVQGIGSVKVKLHRPVEGVIKTVTVKREGGKWYVAFSVVCQAPAPLPSSNAATGIDVGLTSFAVLADGTEIQNPRHGRKGQARLRIAQRRVARRKKGGKGRKKAVVLLQKAHAHIRNQRAEKHHQAANMLVANYGLIAIEKLNIKGLAGSMLAKSVQDAGWGSFFQKLAYKAESAGRLLVEVDPRGTSQRCSRCGNGVPKTLKDRWHECPACSLSVSRDHNSAMEILRLGLSLVGITWGSSPCVPTEAVCFS
jgi:putative transposase